MRPRALPFVVAVAALLVQLVANANGTWACPTLAGALTTWARALLVVALLPVPVFAVAHIRWLRSQLSEEHTVPGGTYRDTGVRWIFPNTITTAWRRRAAGALLLAATSAVVLLTADPVTWWSILVALAVSLGAALFLQAHRGRASLLYLPLIASALAGCSDSLRPGCLAPLLVFATVAIRAGVDARTRPRGGYDSDEVGIPLDPSERGSLAWSAALICLVTFACGAWMVIAHPAHHCGHRIKDTESNARDIRNAVNRWRGAKESTDCPTIAQLVADKEIDSASKTDDAFGSDFRITCTEDDVFVVSPGCDRRFDTADDIRVPRLPLNQGDR